MRSSTIQPFIISILMVLVPLVVGACDSTKPKASTQSFQRPGGLLMSMAFAPDGQKLASASISALTSIQKAGEIWSEGDEYSAPLEGGIITSIAYSTDGRYLAAGQWSGTVSLWDTSKPQSRPTIVRGVCGDAGSDIINAVAFSPSNNTLAVGCFNGSIALLNSGQPTAKPTMVLNNTGTQVTNVAFSSDGALLAADTSNNTVSLWDTSDLKRAPATLRPPGRSVLNLVFSPAGSLLAGSDYDGAIWLWDTNQPNAEPTVVVTGKGGTDVGSDVESICFTSDGKLLAAGYLDRKLQLWDPSQSNVLIDKFTDFRGPVQKVACSPTEPIVATATGDIIRLFNVKD